MRIAIFSDGFYPELSGISDSIIASAKALAARGHEIRFYAPRHSKASYKKIGKSAEELDLGPGISIRRFASLPYPTGTGQGRLVIPSFWRWIGVKRWKPDIIHSQLFFGCGIEALIAAKLLNIPFIGTNHTAITEFIKYSPIKAQWLTTLSLKYAIWYYNRCKFMSAPSRSVITEMQAFGFHTPARVVSNPIDMYTFHPIESVSQKEALKKTFSISGPMIAYAGRLSPEKCVDVIMNALALVRHKVPTAELVIAGHGQSLNELKVLSRKLNIESAVHFTGTIPPARVAELFRAADVFVIASTSETQNMSMMQAMATGVPIVGARARALPEYINAENGFLFEPGNVQELAQDLITLLENEGLRKKLGSGSRAGAEAYSLPRIAAIWEDIYKSNSQK